MADQITLNDILDAYEDNTRTATAWYERVLPLIHRAVQERDATPTSAGADAIALERHRQIAEEGWTPDHDDEHGGLVMARAASGYIEAAMYAEDCLDLGITDGRTMPLISSLRWPWHPDWWKPSPDPRRNLVKAGALIAAEIDRLDREANRG